MFFSARVKPDYLWSCKWELFPLILIFCHVFDFMKPDWDFLWLFFPADIDECAAKMHYCHANTVCVNLPGSYRCDCVMGYVRVDDFSCTGELLHMYTYI